jgi:hypothetical protein
VTGTASASISYQFVELPKASRVSGWSASQDRNRALRPGTTPCKALARLARAVGFEPTTTGFAVTLSNFINYHLLRPMDAQVATITEVVFPECEMSIDAVRKARVRERRRST